MTICRGPRSIRLAAICLSTLFLATLLVSGTARAQAEGEATARSLFNESKKLMKAGKYAEACPKLEAAARLYTSAGILLNLGDCYEKTGRTASAWAKFNDARSVAGRTNRPAEGEEAGRRLSNVEKKLTYVTIRVPNATTGLVVTRDGDEVLPGAFGVPVAVDPGTHEVRAEAPGHEPWSAKVEIAGEGQTTTVDVPELVATPEAPTAPAAAPGPAPSAPGAEASAPPAEAPAEATHSSVLGWALVGGGAAIGIGGAVLLAVEAHRSQDAADRGDTSAYDSTKTPWAIGLAGTIVGGVAASTGVVLLVMNHGESKTSTGGLRAHPWVGVGSGGVELQGDW